MALIVLLMMLRENGVLDSLNFVKVFLVEIGNIRKIRTETFGNYFAMETSADEIDVITKPSFRENVDSLLAQSHNTPLSAPKILHNHCLQVLLGHEDVLREIKNNAYANFWGVKGVYYGICASSELLNGMLNY